MSRKVNCCVENCTRRKVNSNGMCNKHFMEHNKVNGIICSSSKCNNGVWRKDLCMSHYNKMLNKNVRTLQCVIPNCKKKRKAQSKYCAEHYKQCFSVQPKDNYENEDRSAA